MKNFAAANPMTSLMNEYIVWGGPIVTRAEAVKDAQLRGLSAKCIDISIFGRKAVDAPECPEWHVDFLRQIQQMDGIVLEVAA